MKYLNKPLLVLNSILFMAAYLIDSTDLMLLSSMSYATVMISVEIHKNIN